MEGLKRFLEAQNQMYLQALAEVKNGHKESHWMWFIFPQVDGLGSSSTAKFYAIANLKEAAAFLSHPVLGKHLIEICKALLQISGKTATAILGTPDDLKMHSSMTLFSKVKNTDPVFSSVLEKYFQGLDDPKTMEILSFNTIT